MNMRYILLPEEKISRRLAFYLAVEEVVARRYPGVDAFFAWRVSPTVIVGRNQLIDKEVDYTFCRANGIDLVRRKSGGGAVFADEGDLMFSYILTAPDTVEAFRDAMERTAGVLRAAGVEASLSGRNDVMVDGKKVSGAALYRIGDRCIVHNTLLFQTDLDLLERVLTPPAEKLAGKGVASVREHVMNIGPRTGMDIDGFLRFTRQRLCGDETLTLTSDDILEAENNLRGIIADLDRAMKETFAEKFRDIQTMFNKVFKELFGGGKASLMLVDEEDILETGIIINAQPPGKKLQNMMQLSGGEKSLTAISLLFAIQSLKPSPFCLLDEIEAALDDSNVNRFAGYLDKLTKHTQFVVITHRKGTMEAANRLYGITMQEKGVSTLVSVNLIEDKLDD